MHKLKGRLLLLLSAACLSMVTCTPDNAMAAELGTEAEVVTETVVATEAEVVTEADVSADEFSDNTEISEMELQDASSGTLSNGLTYTIEKGTLTISGNGAIPDFSSPSGAPWYEDRTSISKIVVSEGITGIGKYAFYGLTSTGTISFPSTLTTIGVSAFSGCSALREAVLPEKLTSIGEYAFYECTALSSIAIPDSVTSLGQFAFYHNTALLSAKIGKGITEIPKNCFYNCSAMTTLSIGENVTTIGYCAFSSCSALESVTIPDSVITIGENAFNHNGIKTLVIGDGVTTINNNAFGNCRSLTTVTFGKNLKTLGACAFMDCLALKSVVIPDTVTEMGTSCFNDCQAMTSATIGNGITDIPQDCFFNCDALTSLNLGKNIETIGESAFYSCGSLPQIVIPDGVVEIGWLAFSGCSSAKYISIGDSVTTIGYSAFSDCTSAQSIRIGNSVTTIGSKAFSACTAATNIVVGSSVTTIESEAFQYNYALKSITFRGSAPSIKSDAFKSTPKNSSAYAYYPSGNATWTSSVMQNYGGSLIWTAKSMTADKDFWVTRIAGDNRYATAIKSAQELKEVLNVDQFDTVVLASGVNFPDALAGSPLAAINNAPILLIGPDNNAGTIETIEYVKDNLKAGGKVYILGGTSAVSSNTESTLKADGFSVTRLAGDDRYETNLQIVNAMNVKTGTDVVIVRGYTSYKSSADAKSKKNPQGYADSLAVSGVAGAKGMPIFLAAAGGLSDEQLAAIQKINPAHVYIIGGTSAVSTAIYNDTNGSGQLASYNVKRIYGADRYQTSVAIAKEFGLTSAKNVVVAYGQNFPDGLTGGVLAAKLNAPLLLVESTKTDVQKTFLYGSSCENLYILGGYGVIPQTAIEKLIYND